MQLESLESRRLMAGTVTVTLDPVTQKLNIAGDNKSNQVVIGFDSGTASVTVQGTNGTTISGPTAASVFVVSSLRVDMGNGDDSVRFDSGNPILFVGLDVPVQVTTGNGDDSVATKNMIFADLNISTGNGNDHVELDGGQGTFLPGTIEVDTGNGSDSVAIDSLVATGATIDGGNGPDTLTGAGNIALFGGGSPSIIDVETIT